MAEYINKAELWKKMTQKYDEVADALEVVDGMPTIDIVHCEECKNQEDDGYCKICGCHGDDWFCADGERGE